MIRNARAQDHDSCQMERESVDRMKINCKDCQGIATVPAKSISYSLVIDLETNIQLLQDDANGILIG